MSYLVQFAKDGELFWIHTDTAGAVVAFDWRPVPQDLPHTPFNHSDFYSVEELGTCWSA